jgi:hypothetical protein
LSFFNFTKVSINLTRELAKTIKFKASKINEIDDKKMLFEPMSQNSNTLFKIKEVIMMNNLSIFVVLMNITSSGCTNGLY